MVNRLQYKCEGLSWDPQNPIVKDKVREEGQGNSSTGVGGEGIGGALEFVSQPKASQLMSLSETY